MVDVPRLGATSDLSAERAHVSGQLPRTKPSAATHATKAAPLATKAAPQAHGLLASAASSPLAPKQPSLLLLLLLLGRLATHASSPLAPKQASLMLLGLLGWAHHARVAHGRGEVALKQPEGR